MTPQIQNFSVSAGDNHVLEFLVEIGDVETTGAEISWGLYAQENGILTDGAALVEKILDYGIEAETESGILSFSVELEQGDTADRLGNFYHEAKIVDGNGKNLTLAYGILTVTGRSSSLSSRSLKLRFPELGTIDDWTLEFAIEAAVRMVDDSWIAEDIPTARAYLAAHLASLAETDGDTSGGTVASESIGRISVSYASTTDATRTSMLRGTTYGRRYLELMRGSHAGPIVI